MLCSPVGREAKQSVDSGAREESDLEAQKGRADAPIPTPTQRGALFVRWCARVLELESGPCGFYVRGKYALKSRSRSNTAA